MSQAFYRKWRPQKWDQVIAQDHVVQTLRNAVRAERTGHAYLLAGPRGTGKTTTARLLAKALNCLATDPADRPCDECIHCKAINEGRFLDLIEIDAASNTSVDDVRDLREKINFSPSQGKYKVYIIDEVHMLSTAAFNALLKTLEEPPPHAVFILATTEVHKIPATILSRVQRYEFRRIPVEEIKKHLRRMAEDEHLQVDEDALQLIARQATGAMRDAISLLDQLASSGERVTLKEAQTVLGTATNRMVIELVEALLAKDAGAGMRHIQSALDGGTDARQFARQVVEYLRSLLLVKMGNADQVDATREMRQEMAGYAGQYETPHLLEAIRVFNTASVDTRSGWHPGLALELAVAECVAPPASTIAPAYVGAADAQAGAAPAQPTTSPAAGTLPPRSAARRPTSPPEEPPFAEEPPALNQKNTAREGSTPPASTPARAAQPDKAAPAAREESTRARPEASQPAARPPSGAAAKPEPGSPPPAGLAKTVTYHELQQNWDRIREMVKKRNKVTEAALNSSRYALKDGTTLVLTFQTELVKSKMETEENIKILAEALQAILNARLIVRCVVSGVKSDKASDLDVDGDGIVGTALDLGGKIVYDE